VTVTVGRLRDGFYVEDNGPGIPEEHHEKVFDEGFTTSDEGTGFGLSIIDTIVDAHGWSITVTESDEGGARFEIADVIPPQEQVARSVT
jgi:signal transduction histidine kinase